MRLQLKTPIDFLEKDPLDEIEQGFAASTAVASLTLTRLGA